MPHLPALALLSLLTLASRAQTPAAAPGSSASGSTDPQPAWETAIAQRRQELITRNGPGTDTSLRDRLLTMRQTDQAARTFMTSASDAAAQQQRIQHLAETDAQLTSELKAIVAQHGWPTISLVGIDASDAAMLLLTHSPDHAWQQQLLPQLEQLADSRLIDTAPLALVIDKQLVASGKLQRYGTQFKFVNGHMAMFAVEDPGNLDNIRARAMLSPLSAYKQLLARMYGVKASNDIIGATPPASTP